MRHANDNNPSGLTYLSVCSGIEAASVAWHPLGWRAVAYSEIEKFPSAVLSHHYPDVPNLGDFTKIDVASLGQVDILCGGTPCQAFSVAGLRQSLADERGNLSLEFVRLAHELAASNGLRNVVWENVVGVLSTKDNAFGCFLAGLVGADSAIEPPRRGKWPGAGMVSGPKGRAAWRVLDAQYFGVAQRRRRVIVVADFGNGADPAAILFEQDGVRRYSPPSREKGKGTATDVAPSLVSSGRGVERTGDTRGQDPVVAVLRGHSDYGPGAPTLRAKGGDCAGGSEALVFAPEIARCDATREGSSQDYETTTMVAVGVHGDIAHTLKAEGADASEDGTGRGTPVIAFSAKDYGADASFELSPTLRAGGHTTSHANAGVMPAIAFQSSQSGVRIGDVRATLDSNNGSRRHNGAVVGSAVRRLTPRECERLQGFPDDYTAIPWRGKPADQCPDGPRYKALGNSWAVPKFAWLGRRIAKMMPPVAANDNQPVKEAA
ncbi:methyltransferase [Sinorhizobium phage NV1.1.1]|nr:methyltransferase [Sinorhizobium phage NV1.1.1]